MLLFSGCADLYFLSFAGYVSLILLFKFNFCFSFLSKVECYWAETDFELAEHGFPCPGVLNLKKLTSSKETFHVLCLGFLMSIAFQSPFSF